MPARAVRKSRRTLSSFFARTPPRPLINSDTMDIHALPTGEGDQRAAKRQRTDAESTSLSPTRGNPVADTAKPVTNLAPSGDVVPALSDHSRLRVHSVVLKLASPVFKAMFGPHFSEGQNLSEANPKEVPLPDDPPEAMIIICEILHYHNRSEPAPRGELPRVIVTLVDKYDLIAATGLKIKSFLEEHIEAANPMKSSWQCRTS